jgi:hypothetical protein
MKHAESGWATENLIVEYMEWLHWEIAGGRPCVLIFDVYPTHRPEVMVNTAAELFVRTGGTSEYQPLDYRIFGELKSRATAEITRLIPLGGIIERRLDRLPQF